MPPSLIRSLGPPPPIHPPLLAPLARDVRILHTYVLEDPFDDPAGLSDLIPDASPECDRPPEEAVNPRLTDLVDEEDGLTAEELEERIREAEAKKRAVVLEMIGWVDWTEGGRIVSCRKKGSVYSQPACLTD